MEVGQREFGDLRLPDDEGARGRRDEQHPVDPDPRHLPPHGALSALSARLPRVRVDVTEAEPPDVFTALDTGRLDLVIAVDFAATPPHTDRRYVRTDLLTDILDVALPPDHHLAHADRVALRDLATDPWLVGDPRSCCGAVTRSVSAAAGFTPDIRHAVNDWSALTALVEAGTGVALVPRLLHPLHRTLHLRPTTGEPPSRNIFAAVRTGSESDAVLDAVLEELRTAAGRRSGAA
ncbi:LysR substrate-binding domain-containing protein [Streptomyces sp. NPDC006458]|uniref:LysR substrate-binding domain-containing protein n=1 Tax=Streptomyces sp. NPDC006458 TaxID=3154302 RepID=UPI0033AEB967